ncbi:MAG: hypothetical protein KJ915_12780 [Candidatus Omnitrophica bacterium]|nr:hypothetical protein [Candidatus Omnitrophota bacterium]
MSKQNKIWFNAYSRTLWIPVCWQGWVVILAFSASIGLIYITNNVSDNVPFDFAKHWPLLVELASVFISVNLISKGHIDKKY